MEEYKRWIEKADSEFDTAVYNLKGNKIEAAGFFFQQSAEKALKAAHIKKFKKLIKTHDLVILSNALNAPNEVIQASKDLTPAYQYTRYPEILKEKDLSELIEELKNDAEVIIS